MSPCPTDAGQVDERIEQHRCVTAGEHEPVAIGPGGVGGIVAQEILPHGVGHGRQCHRSAGVTALGGFDRVHREGSNGVDGEAVDVGAVMGARSGGGGNGHETGYSKKRY